MTTPNDPSPSVEPKPLSLRARRRRFSRFPGEQLAVTLVLLVIFGVTWRYGDPSRRANRNAALDAATREATTAGTGLQSATGPGYGRREVATRPFEDLREVTNSVGITLREVPRTLGLVGNANDPDGDAPQRVVKTDPFFIGTTEVTRAQWKRISGAFSDPSIYVGPAASNDALPVNNVDFPDAVRFCKLLSAREGRNYRLPTEYEWEIACWGRRTDAVFATRFATEVADRVGSGEWASYSSAQQADLLNTMALESYRRAKDDLIRLGFDPAEARDVSAFERTRDAINDAAVTITIALSASPPNGATAPRSRVYDAVLPKALVELQQASYARHENAAAARFEEISPDGWTGYGKYQATWWTGRDPLKPQGHPFGLHDMLGSMMEWTATPTMPYPYSTTLRDVSAQEVSAIRFEEANIPMSRWATLEELPRFAFNRTLRDTTFYIVRGGSFERAVESCTPWNRYGQLPLRTRFTAHRESLGFRVVLEP